MPIPPNVCRICGSTDVKALPVGFYAPFFKLRVDTRKDPYLLFIPKPWLEAPPPVKKTFAARVVLKLLKLTGKFIFPHKEGELHDFRTNMQFCGVCKGMTPVHEYSIDDLAGLYADYYTGTYTKARISVEPAYAKICRSTFHEAEINYRNSELEKFLAKNETFLSGGRALDMGGSDGRFIPPIVLNKFSEIHVLDSSDIKLHSSLAGRNAKKIRTLECSDYSLLLCMHVIEHVGSPRSFIEAMATHVKPGGLLYFETPIELSPQRESQFASNLIDPPQEIHEHISLFSGASIPKCVESIKGLELIASQEYELRGGYSKFIAGRYLIRKN